MTFWTKLERFPPIAIRLLASKRIDGHGKIALTDEEIAADSGLSVPIVKSLSWLTSWDTVAIGTAQAFLRGCRIDLNSREKMRFIASYLKSKPTYRYLQKDPTLWETQFKPLVAVYLSHRR